MHLTVEVPGSNPGLWHFLPSFSVTEVLTLPSGKGDEPRRGNNLDKKTPPRITKAQTRETWGGGGAAYGLPSLTKKYPSSKGYSCKSNLLSKSVPEEVMEICCKPFRVNAEEGEGIRRASSSFIIHQSYIPFHAEKE